jgi:hypothetical protein
LLSWFRLVCPPLSCLHKCQQELNRSRGLERGKPYQGHARAQEIPAERRVGQPVDGPRRDQLDGEDQVGAVPECHRDDAEPSDLQLAEDGSRRRGAQASADPLDDQISPRLTVR